MFPILVELVRAELVVEVGVDVASRWRHPARLQRLPGTVGTAYQGGVKSGVPVAGYDLTGADDHEIERRAQELARWYATGVRWTGHHGEDDHAALD
ncbi:hypothetical protein ACIGPN_29370 [Streptomyces afghaniensis]|uniref:hypothetical protein n=1 Tax=Streptomyces afghaniensis TaxID=66865 RepID=UPI0037D23DC0